MKSSNVKYLKIANNVCPICEKLCDNPIESKSCCNKKLEHIKKIIYNNRAIWQKVANKNNWLNKENIFIQIWFNPDMTVNDSLSHLGLKEDIFILCDENENEIKISKNLNDVLRWFENV